LLTSEYFPGILHYRDIELPEAVELLYLLNDEGMFGSITGISATFVALFVIFGAFVHVSGTGRFFTKLACKIAGRARGGPAKIAVVSSGFFGAISGVAAANVYTTGTFSIPLMKQLGYRKQFAGAVEAAASTGGMILPPVMGAGAFVMAEITGIPYVTICFAAVIGAVMYFLSIGIMVHLEAVKYDLKPMAEDELPSVKEIIKDSYLLIPLVGLVYFLMIGYSPFMAAFVSILLSVAVMLGELLVQSAAYGYRSRTAAEPQSGEVTLARHLMKGLYGLGLKITDGLVLGGRNMIMVALACAGAGFVVSVITNTGLGLAFSSVIIAYSNGIAILALMFVMVASIILGMGLPCTPAYIIAASVGAPALLKMGGDLLAAHLFVYYFAILASVTPPVCITAYAGAALAGANPMRTGLEAFALALGGFLVPYVFYFDPALLMQGDFLEIASSVLRLFFMIVMLAVALQGWLLKKVPLTVRGGLIALAVSLPVVFSSKLLGSLIGMAALALLYVFQSRKIAQEQESLGR
jgi:TRAP transporter 4TM/12TM fusion protein